MLLREENPRVMIRIGMVFVLFFFLMNLLPHPTSPFGDGLFDGVHGMLLGVAIGLMMWGTYLNGRNRRAANRT
jgi:uncharacterized membrane protein YccC